MIGHFNIIEKITTALSNSTRVVKKTNMFIDLYKVNVRDILACCGRLVTSKLISNFVVLYNYTITIHSFSKQQFYEETNDVYRFSCARNSVNSDTQ